MEGHFLVPGTHQVVHDVAMGGGGGEGRVRLCDITKCESLLHIMHLELNLISPLLLRKMERILQQLSVLNKKILDLCHVGLSRVGFVSTAVAFMTLAV